MPVFKRVILIVGLIALAWWVYERWLQRRPWEWSGTVETRTIAIGSRAGGRVKSILVDEGDRVTAGQAIIVLEPGDFEARAALAAAELAESKARLSGAESAQKKARADRERAESLAGKNIITQEERDRAEVNQREAEAGSAAASAAVDAATARLAQARYLVNELTIVSPCAARVEALDLRPGDLLAVNAKAATLLEDDQLFVRIYVPETQIGHIAVGAKLPVYVDSFPNEAFAGVVEHINDVGEFSPRNLQTADERANQVFGARVRLDANARTRLRAGMAAFVRVNQ
jgi:RND family efflux transporter MFP subunit